MLTHTGSINANILSLKSSGHERGFGDYLAYHKLDMDVSEEIKNLYMALFDVK